VDESLQARRSQRDSLDGAMARRLAAGLLLPLLSGCSIAVSLYVVNRSAKPVASRVQLYQLSGTHQLSLPAVTSWPNASAPPRGSPSVCGGRVDSVLVYRSSPLPDSLSVWLPNPPRQEPGSFYAGPTGAHGASPSSRVKTQSVISGRELFTASHNIGRAYWVLEVPLSP